MFKVPLERQPNQSVSFNVDGAYWSIKIFQAIDQMYADISRDGAAIISATRCLVGQPLLPYAHLHLPNFGNFIFDSEVDWNNFAGSCGLYYLTIDEYNEYKLELSNGN